MKTHTLKTWPHYFDAVACGAKTFEGRKNDRDFQPGDTVILQRTCDTPAREVEKDAYGNAKHELVFHIGFVLRGEAGRFGIEDGWCVFSLLPVNSAVR